MFSLGLIAAYLFMALGVVSSLMGKYLTVKLDMYRYSLMLVGIGIIPLLFLLLGPIAGVSLWVFALSVLAGLAFGAGNLLYYKACTSEQITNISALGQIEPAILFIFGFAVLTEPFNAIEILCVIAIFVGSMMLMLNKGMKMNSKLIPVVISYALFAVYWIFLNYAIEGYGSTSMPLVISRVIAFVAMLAFMLIFTRKKLFTGKSIWGSKKTVYVIAALVAASALIDGFRNILFGIVVQAQIIAFGSVLSAAIPIFTAILAYVIFRDRLTRIQLVGLVVAVIGAAVLAIA